MESLFLQEKKENKSTCDDLRISDLQLLFLRTASLYQAILSLHLAILLQEFYSIILLQLPKSCDRNKLPYTNS